MEIKNVMPFDIQIKPSMLDVVQTKVIEPPKLDLRVDLMPVNAGPMMHGHTVRVGQPQHYTDQSVVQFQPGGQLRAVDNWLDKMPFVQALTTARGVAQLYGTNRSTKITEKLIGFYSSQLKQEFFRNEHVHVDDLKLGQQMITRSPRFIEGRELFDLPEATSKLLERVTQGLSTHHLGKLLRSVAGQSVRLDVRTDVEQARALTAGLIGAARNSEDVYQTLIGLGRVGGKDRVRFGLLEGPAPKDVDDLTQWVQVGVTKSLLGTETVEAKIHPSIFDSDRGVNALPHAAYLIEKTGELFDGVRESERRPEAVAWDLGSVDRHYITGLLPSTLNRSIYDPIALLSPLKNKARFLASQVDRAGTSAAQTESYFWQLDSTLREMSDHLKRVVRIHPQLRLLYPAPLNQQSEAPPQRAI